MEPGKPLHSLNSSLIFSSPRTHSASNGGPVSAAHLLSRHCARAKTNAVPSASGVGNHARYLLEVAVGDKQGFAQLALRFGRL